MVGVNLRNLTPCYQASSLISVIYFIRSQSVWVLISEQMFLLSYENLKLTFFKNISLDSFDVLQALYICITYVVRPGTPVLHEYTESLKQG